MDFIVTEKNGTEPIEEWLIAGIKNHAKQKFGVVLNVEIKKEEPTKDDKPSE